MKMANEIAYEYIQAYGPSSAAAVLAYLREQYDENAQIWEVSAMLNNMIKRGVIELYDTGDGFVTANS